MRLIRRLNVFNNSLIIHSIIKIEKNFHHKSTNEFQFSVITLYSKKIQSRISKISSGEI